MRRDIKPAPSLYEICLEFKIQKFKIFDRKTNSYRNKQIIGKGRKFSTQRVKISLQRRFGAGIPTGFPNSKRVYESTRPGERRAIHRRVRVHRQLEQFERFRSVEQKLRRSYGRGKLES